MEILYLLIPVSIVLVFAIGVAFWWSLRSGQFDDLEGPAYRILMDDDHSPALPDAPVSAANSDSGSVVDNGDPGVGNKFSGKNATL